MKRALFLTVSLLATAFSLYTAIEVHRIKQTQRDRLRIAAPPQVALPLNKKAPAPQQDQPKVYADPGYGVGDLAGQKTLGKYYNEDHTLQRVPVLCYHRIDSNKKDNYYSILENYIWQMEYLVRHHKVISTAHLVDYIRYRQGVSKKPVTLPKNAVVIQFDDNYRSVYSKVFPIMRRLGLKWTFFIYKHHHRPNPIAHLREMARAGVDIQSHTMTHPWFHKPAKKQSMQAYIREMHWQVNGSKKFVEQLTGRPVLYLAYPFGTYSDLAISLCRKYGYQGMFAADGGYATEKSPLYAIERILVTKGWSQNYFKQVVSGKIRYKRQFKPTRLLSPKPPVETHDRASLRGAEGVDYIPNRAAKPRVRVPPSLAVSTYR